MDFTHFPKGLPEVLREAIVQNWINKTISISQHMTKNLNWNGKSWFAIKLKTFKHEHNLQIKRERESECNGEHNEQQISDFIGNN